MKPFNCVQTKRALVRLKNIFNEMCLLIIYLKYMYEQDLALNNLQWLRYYKPKLNIHMNIDVY